MSTRVSCIGFVLLSVLGCPAPSDPPDTGASKTILTMEQNAFDLLNAQRVQNGLAPLVMRDDLRQLARAFSQDMIDRGFFSHTDPDGKDPFDRMADAGITYTSAGENIAWNNFDDPVATAVDGWMNSSGHRANILRASFTHTGMGVAYDATTGRYFFTQEFVGTAKGATGGYVETYIYDPGAGPTAQ